MVDEMIAGLPDRMKEVIFREALAQANTVISTMQSAADAAQNDPTFYSDDMPEEYRNVVNAFLESVMAADKELITSIFINGFINGAGHIFRTMSLLDSMAQYLDSPNTYDTDDEDDTDDDDGSDRAGLPKDSNPNSGLCNLSNDDIHSLITGLDTWINKKRG